MLASFQIVNAVIVGVNLIKRSAYEKVHFPTNSLIAIYSVRHSVCIFWMHYCLILDRVFFFFPNKSEKSKPFPKDGSSSLGLFRKSKTRIIAKFHGTDLVFCSDSREGKTPSYSRRNMVYGEALCLHI